MELVRLEIGCRKREGRDLGPVDLICRLRKL